MRKQLLAGLLAVSMVFMSSAPASAAGYKKITGINDTVQSGTTPTDFTATLDMFETTVTIPASLTLSWNSKTKVLEADDKIFARGNLADGYDLLVYTDKYINYTKDGSNTVKTGNASVDLYYANDVCDNFTLFTKSDMTNLQSNNGYGVDRNIRVNLPIDNVPAVGTYKSNINFKVFKSPNAVAVDSLVGKSFEAAGDNSNLDLSSLNASKGYHLKLEFDTSLARKDNCDLLPDNKDVVAFYYELSSARKLYISVKPGATFDALSLSSSLVNTGAKCTSATVQYLS